MAVGIGRYVLQGAYDKAFADIGIFSVALAKCAEQAVCGSAFGALAQGAKGIVCR